MLASPDQQISLTDSDGRSMATSGRGSCFIGLFDEVPFLSSIALDVIGVGLAFLAAPRFISGRLVRVFGFCGANVGRVQPQGSFLFKRCQMRTVSLRAVATAAICWPRFALVRRKNARKGAKP
jgi:hypothetical protein